MASSRSSSSTKSGSKTSSYSKGGSTTKGASTSQGASTSHTVGTSASSGGSSTVGGGSSHTESDTYFQSHTTSASIGGSTSQSQSSSLGGNTSQSQSSSMGGSTGQTTGKSWASGQVSDETQAQRERWQQDYVPSQQVQDTYKRLQDTLNSKPGAFSSSYTNQLDSLYNQILNRKAFSYNPNADAMYQALRQQYQTQGKQAMQDTMGQAAKLTGGYSSSYAQTAAQQTYQNYLTQLANQVPSLRNQAYQEYTDEGNRLNNLYSLAGQQYNRDYQNYRDAMSDWQNNRAYDTSAYQDERNFDYQNYANNRQYWNQEYWNERNAEQSNASNSKANNWSNTIGNEQSQNWSNSKSNSQSSNWSKSESDTSGHSHTTSDTNTSNWSNTSNWNNSISQQATAAQNAQATNSLSNTDNWNSSLSNTNAWSNTNSSSISSGSGSSKSSKSSSSVASSTPSYMSDAQLQKMEQQLEGKSPEDIQKYFDTLYAAQTKDSDRKRIIQQAQYFGYNKK